MGFVYKGSFRLIFPDDPKHHTKTWKTARIMCRYEQFDSYEGHENNQFLIHQLGDYLISNKHLKFRSSQHCPKCEVSQPFNDWCCQVCGSFSSAGDPHDESEFNKDFDEVFESLTESDCFEYIGETKFNNQLYKRIK